MKTMPKDEFDADELNLIKLAQEYNDDEKARTLLESILWPHGAVCPHCKNDGKQKTISKLTPKAGSKSAVRKGVYFCGACRKQFTVTVKTVFESSHVKIQTWVMAWFLICSSKKGMSAHQLHRMLGVTYKTAWFMAHRIRHAMGTDLKTAPPLANVCEADETFLTDKENPTQKSCLALVVERGGQVRTRVIASVTAKNVGKFMAECVDKSATVNTDEHAAYPGPLKDYARHDRVNHGRFEYARHNPDGTVSHINTGESFFSLLKRGVFGAWHCISKEHLPKTVLLLPAVPRQNARMAKIDYAETQSARHGEIKTRPCRSNPAWPPCC
jgi:transposase-like protein